MSTVVTPTPDRDVVCALYSPHVTSNLDFVNDWALPGLLTDLAGLPGLTDTALTDKAADAIMRAALNSRYDEQDLLASACYEESLRRQQAAGHHSNCNSGVYARAYASVARSQGHSPERVECACTALRAAGIRDNLAGTLPVRS